MELFPSTRVPLLQPTTRTEEELMQSRMAEHKPARMPSTAATENLQHSAESRNSGASQERSDRIAPRDSYSSSEAQLEINYQEVSIANIFRGFLGNLPSLDVPRERMRSIERSLSQKSLGECSEETGRSRARSIERSLSHKSPRDHSTGTGHFRSGDQSVADYSKSSDPFRARKPDQYESRCEPSQPRIPQARPEQYQSREYAPPQQGNMEALYLGQQNALGSTPISLSPLSWRLDPRESLSDWQIKVVRTDSGTEDLYHVHRAVLTAVGPRQSEYFVDLFQEQTHDPNGHRLRLEMPDDIAGAFPVLLDYMYGEDDIASVRKRKHAFFVYDQAEFFHMPGLEKAVANWFRRRLQWFDAPRFLEEIKRFQNNDPLVRVVVEKCANQFDELGPQFAVQIGPVVFVQVLNQLGMGRYVFHQHVDHTANLVLACCQAYKMDHQTFRQLTNNRFLPMVPPQAAIKLLVIDTKLSDHNAHKLSCLHIRCVRSLSRHWEDLCYEFPSAEAMADTLSHLPPSVLAQLLVRTASVPW
jgi:hypothetical protein